MKTRNSYVSNSSSSSFLIFNWSGVPEDKKDMVLNPTKYIVSLWKEKNVPFSIKYGSRCADGQNSEYDFGFIDELWEFKINEKNDFIEFTTLMDNFDMVKWVEWLGMEYKYLGESWGYFSDEPRDGKQLFEHDGNEATNSSVGCCDADRIDIGDVCGVESLKSKARKISKAIEFLDRQLKSLSEMEDDSDLMSDTHVSGEMISMKSSFEFSINFLNKVLLETERRMKDEIEGK